MTMRLVLTALAALALLAPDAALAQRQQEDSAFTWSGRVPAGRWIRIRNLNGSVTVGQARGDKVEVTAIRRWRRSDPETVRFEVRRFGPGEESVVVCALWSERTHCDQEGDESHGGTRNNDVSVDFRVAVPRGVKIGAWSVNGGVRVDSATSEVEVGSVNGSVEAATSGGPVNASTTNGSVRARMGRFTADQDLTFSTTNGSVIAEFTGDLDAEVELSTVNGRFHTDYPVTVSGRLDPRELRARIGKGGRRIRMATTNGNVELRRRD